MFQKVLKVEKFAGLGDVEFAMPFGILMDKLNSLMDPRERLALGIAKGLKDRR